MHQVITSGRQSDLDSKMTIDISSGYCDLFEQYNCIRKNEHEGLQYI